MGLRVGSVVLDFATESQFFSKRVETPREVKATVTAFAELVTINKRFYSEYVARFHTL